MKGTLVPVSSLLVAFIAIGCAKDRPLKPVIEDSLRVRKSQLEGTYSYLRTVVDSRYTANSKMFIPSGYHETSDSLVQFVIKRDALEVTSIDPLYNDAATAKHSAVLLSFPIKHVDVLRKQNPDGTETHEEEQTESRRPWNEREYIVIDTTTNNVDFEEYRSPKSVTALTGIQVDAERKHIDFKVEKTLSNNRETSESENSSVVVERFSFLKFEPSSTYQQRLYSRDLQQRFGVFKTRTYQFDQYGRALQSLLVEMMNRWDTSKKVVYYLSANFPEHLKPTAHAVFRTWNDAFVKATGHDVLQLRENSGQEIGDLRYSMVVYIDSDEVNGLLGYGPSVANPRTGELIKADVFLYGGSLKRSIHREREWLAQSQALQQKPRPPKSRATNFASRIANFLADSKFANLKSFSAGSSDAVKEAITSVRNKNGALDSSVLIGRMKSKLLRRGMEFTTELNEDTVSLVSNLTAESLSDEEIEVRIFGPLLSHELGHTLGLRHNFMASSDHVHFPGESKSSSVMDYGFLSTEEPTAPGPYDVAAIQVVYGDGKAETIRAHVDQNYFYCTDEHLFDARYGSCHQFDSGATLADIAKNQIVRYFRSYAFNNRRNDRLSFPRFGDYINRILRSLIPVRLVYDNANAIVEHGGAYLENASLSPNEDDDRALWSLLKQRVEAGPDSHELRSVQVSTNRRVSLDVKKLRQAVKDAVQARGLAFTGLRLVLMDNNPGRPDRDGADWELGELMVRGVLVDKVYALLLLMIPTTDPASGGGIVTVFDQFHQPMSKTLSDLISNTTFTQEGLQIGVADINLRYVALDFIQEFATTASLSTGELLELITLQRVVGQPIVTATNELKVKKLAEEVENLRKDLGQAQLEMEFNPTPEAQKKVDDLKIQVSAKSGELSGLQIRLSVGETDPDAEKLVTNALVRSEIVNLLIQMEATGPSEEAQKKVGELFEKLTANNIAQVLISDGRILKAPLQFSTFGNLETASGRFLFYNLNLIEDRAKIVRGLMIMVDLVLAVAKSEEQKKELQALKTQLINQSLMLERYVASERRFAQRLYDVHR